jgi:error-prone DNA polymerase
LQARLLEVQGIVEQGDGTTHVIAGRLRDQTALLAELPLRSRDFH